MTTDMFQFSNMYTLQKNIQWLADEAHVISHKSRPYIHSLIHCALQVRDECGPYVTKPMGLPPDWPHLLHLYSRLRPGRTVQEWMVQHNIHKLDIDVRRFISFGVIKFVCHVLFSSSTLLIRI